MVEIKRKLPKLESRKQIFQFGKHKGQTVSHVLIYDPYYILWLNDEEVMEVDGNILGDAMTSAYDDDYGDFDFWGIDLND